MARNEQPDLGLAEVLQSLGEELRKANATAGELANPSLVWEDAVVEVMLGVNVTAKGGVKFSVLGIGAEGGADRESTRMIRAQVRVTPFPAAASGDVRVSALTRTVGVVERSG